MSRAALTLSAVMLILPTCALAESKNAAKAGDASAVGGELATGFAKTQVVVSAETDKTDASIVLSHAKDFDTGRTLGFNAWSLKATVPLQKGDQSASFVTDLGLAHVNSLELSWTSLRTGATPDARSPDEILADAAKRCHAAGGKAADCDSGNSETLRTWMTPAEEAAMFPDPTGIWTYGWTVTADIGAKSFDYRDPTSLDQLSKDRTMYSVSAQYGGIRQFEPGDPFSGWYWGLGGEYKRDYSDAKSRTLCRMPTSSGPQECFTSPFGPPEEKTTETVFGLARRRMHLDAFDLDWGVQLKPAYDFESRVAGIEATLYVLPSEDGHLTGGIRGKLQTKDHDPQTKDDSASLAIFVGAPF